ncbi:hypothetical protein [Flavobacterium sp.]|uniref:hypothetical protein n=1 Tax=Flavobacterium sp. TaxID=239 RepID=UPI0031D01DC6
MNKELKITIQKTALVTLFLIVGNCLFSCQKKDEKQQKTNTVQAVKDTVVKKQAVVEEIAKDKNDKADSKVSIPSKTDKAKAVKSIESKLSKSGKTDANKNTPQKVVVKAAPSGEVVSETNAEFPGGIDQFYTFFQKEFKKPANAEFYKLKINLAFAIEKNGYVSFLQSDPPINDVTQQEIIRVLNSCPKWQPGESNDKKVKRQYSLPIVLQ